MTPRVRVVSCRPGLHDHRLLVRGDSADFAALELDGEQVYACTTSPTPVIQSCALAPAHTSSCLMCWAVCDRLARIAVELGLP